METEENIPYTQLTYIPQDQHRQDTVTNVYYGTMEEGNWTHLGEIIERSGFGMGATFSVFDANGQEAITETENWDHVERYFQKEGYALQVKEKEREATLKSIRRKQGKEHDQGIEQ